MSTTPPGGEGAAPPPAGGPPPPDGTPPPADGATPRCENCGARLADDQTYCIECGTPTPRAPRLGRRGRAGALLALALIVLGAGAAALAYALASDDGAGATTDTTTVVATGPGATAPIFTIPTDANTGQLPPDTGGFPVVPTDDGFPTITEQPVDPLDPVDPVDPVDPIDPIDPVDPIDPIDPGAGASDWPAGTTGWTAILSSTRSEQEARATADALVAAGQDAGVLYSSDHPGLRPGYWVVWSGNFAGREQAAAHARSLRGAHPGAYPRQIIG